MKTILFILIGLFIIISLLFVYCALRLSSIISENEENYDFIVKYTIKK